MIDQYVETSKYFFIGIGLVFAIVLILSLLWFMISSIIKVFRYKRLNIHEKQINEINDKIYELDHAFNEIDGDYELLEKRIGFLELSQRFFRGRDEIVLPDLSVDQQPKRKPGRPPRSGQEKTPS